MIYALIGHRGVGKSSLLKRLESYGAKTFDLDQEIAVAAGKNISEIFTTQGEEQFRKLEIEALQNILQHNTSDIYVAVGAGFEGPWPVGVKKIWVRRATDAKGRIFLNRPRLNPDLKPLEEFKLRKLERDIRFQAWADQHYFLPEGLPVDEGAEKLFFGFSEDVIGGTLTVLPRHLQDLKLWLSRGLEFFEIRDDLLTEQQALQVFENVPRSRILASMRKQDSYLLRNLDRAALQDWALELGPCPDSVRASILSLHTREVDIAQTLKKVEMSSVEGKYLKLAIPVQSFAELKALHQWWSQDRDQKLFFPNSPNGRWSWYRSLWGRGMRFNFIREDEGTSPDQPTFYDWYETKRWQKNFAAILGDPVDHSWTPTEQQQFFKTLDMPVVRIQISDEELTKDTLDFLCELGLTAAAVTAPLKNKMLTLMDDLSSEAKTMNAVNTFWWDGKIKKGHNTDLEGFKMASHDFAGTKNIAVWGGGGTLEILKGVFPEATFYSARAGAADDAEAPDVLLWAVGRGRTETTKWPPQNWHNKMVVDLNYSEDSPGLEWAEKHADMYLSGEKFFREQARAQRLWWEQNYKPPIFLV